MAKVIFDGIENGIYTKKVAYRHRGVKTFHTHHSLRYYARQLKRLLSQAENIDYEEVNTFLNRLNIVMREFLHDYGKNEGQLCPAVSYGYMLDTICSDAIIEGIYLNSDDDLVVNIAWCGDNTDGNEEISLKSMIDRWYEDHYVIPASHYFDEDNGFTREEHGDIDITATELVIASLDAVANEFKKLEKQSA